MNKTYVFDFDSTLVSCESLDELARIALADNPKRQLVMQQLEDITRAGMAGEVPFDESLRRRLELFRASKPHVDRLTRWLEGQVSPSVLAERQWFADCAADIFVVSGGFLDYIIPVVAMLGIPADHVVANRFVYDDRGVIMGYDDMLPTSKAGGKVLAVQSLRLPRPIIMIGDGFTDFEVKAAGAADEFWVYTEHIQRPQVVAAADRIVHSMSDVLNC